jgi:hypothetical protein
MSISFTCRCLCLVSVPSSPYNCRPSLS